jgi:hypothetical protein
MTDFPVNDDVLEQIAAVTTPCLQALNEEITETFPDQPDAAYSLAVGFAVSVLLCSFNPEERAGVADGINLLVRRCGYVLVPVT